MTLALLAPVEDAAILGGPKEPALVHRESLRETEGEGREDDAAELRVWLVTAKTVSMPRLGISRAGRSMREAVAVGAYGAHSDLRDSATLLSLDDGLCPPIKGGNGMVVTGDECSGARARSSG